MAKIKKAMKGGSKTAKPGKKGKVKESDQVLVTMLPCRVDTSAAPLVKHTRLGLIVSEGDEARAPPMILCRSVSCASKSSA